MNLVKREPAAIAAGIMAVFETAIAVVVTLGIVDWTAEETAAISGFAGALLALVGGLFVRSRVSPV